MKPYEKYTLIVIGTVVAMFCVMAIGFSVKAYAEPIKTSKEKALDLNWLTPEIQHRNFWNSTGKCQIRMALILNDQDEVIGIDEAQSWKRCNGVTTAKKRGLRLSTSNGN